MMLAPCSKMRKTVSRRNDDKILRTLIMPPLPKFFLLHHHRPMTTEQHPQLLNTKITETVVATTVEIEEVVAIIGDVATQIGIVATGINNSQLLGMDTISCSGLLFLRGPCTHNGPTCRCGLVRRGLSQTLK